VSDLGSVTRAKDGGYVLHYVRRLDKPPAKVWEALTDPASLARWLDRADVDLRVGGKFVIHFFDGKETMHGVIRALEPERLLEYSWDETGAPESVVRWTLAPDGAGSRLTLTHILPHGAESGLARELGGGWHILLDALALGEGRHDAAKTRASEERYGKLVEAAPVRAIDGVLTDGEAPVLRFERVIARPVAKVWAALTDERILKKWLGDVICEGLAGGRYVIRFREHQSAMNGTIAVFEPERVLEYSWDEGPKIPRATVRWELTSVEGGTRLVLTQRFARGTAVADVLPFFGGWEALLDALAEGADGRFMPYIDDTPYAAFYREKFA
jgi:uncharacterized protein YndB with AHSA1/START domain